MHRVLVLAALTGKRRAKLPWGSLNILSTGSAFMPTLLAVAVGGAAGAVSRYLASAACVQYLGDRFGYGTLLVNVLGCFLLGFMMHNGPTGLARAPWLAHPGLTAGLLGGLTTFSTFGYQTIGHFERGELKLALVNVAANVVLGCLAAACGIYLRTITLPIEPVS